MKKIIQFQLGYSLAELLIKMR